MKRAKKNQAYSRRSYGGRSLSALVLLIAAFHLSPSALVHAEWSSLSQKLEIPAKVNGIGTYKKGFEGVVIIEKSGDVGLKLNSGKYVNLTDEAAELLNEAAKEASLTGTNSAPLGVLMSTPDKDGKQDIVHLGPPSYIQWKVDLERQVPDSLKGKLKLVDQASDAFLATSEAVKQNPTKEKVTNFANSYSKLKDRIGQTFGEVGDIQVKTHLAKLLRDSQNDAAAQIKILSQDPTVAAAINNGSEDMQILKAYAGRNDNHDVDSHLMIYQIARSCCAIFWKESQNANKPFGSGFLIGPDHVLTCKHVVDKGQAPSIDPPSVAPNRLYVRFDHKLGWDPDTRTFSPAQVVTCKVVDIPYWGTTLDDESMALDYAILKIEWPVGSTPRQPLPILAEPSLMEKPVILIGHPEGAMQVSHENSWIMLPYRIKAQERGPLEAFITKNLLPNPSVSQQGAPQINSAFTAQSFVTAQYVNKDIKGTSWLQYVSRRKNGSRVHSFGAECDTFKGDSGAPAITRDLGEVCGILQQGVKDRNPDGSVYSYVPSAQEHELILPMTAIVEQIGKDNLQAIGVSISQ